jgi:small-conductance mechanosensitive channel
VIGILAALVAVAALIVGTTFGKVSSEKLNPQLIAWVSAAVLLVAGIIAAGRLSSALSHITTRHSIPSARGVVKMISALGGYLLVVLGLLAILGGLEKLLVGAGLAGVVLGIAAQQSLGNVFAGFVLLLARPFVVGDRIRVRAGSLGGIFDSWVMDMSLTYVTLMTDDGPLKVPNSGMLAAGVVQLRPDAAPLPAAVPPTAVPPAAAPPAPAPPAGSPGASGVAGEPGASSATGSGAAGIAATGQPRGVTGGEPTP